MITREVLIRFLNGESSDEEVDELRRYFLKGKLEELNAILEEDWQDTGKEFSDEQLEQQRERIWERLREKNDELEVSAPLVGAPLRTRKINWTWKVVASIVLVCIAFLGYWLQTPNLPGPTSEIGSTMRSVNNEQAIPIDVVLSDGSKVVLEPNSTLHYEAEFAKRERFVRLEGKAFFEVASDSLRPFVVKTNSLNVRVLGTSFTISSFVDKPAEVSVVSGKVAVYVEEQQGAMILAPNERAVRLSESAKLAKLLVEEPVIVHKEVLRDFFDFDEVPVTEVFQALEKAYDVTIRFDPEDVKRCMLRARLEDQPLFVKLDMICTTLGLEYEVVGTDIFIKGVGCE